MYKDGSHLSMLQTNYILYIQTSFINSNTIVAPVELMEITMQFHGAAVWVNTYKRILKKKL